MFLNLVALFVLFPLRSWWTLKEDPAESSSNLGLTLPPSTSETGATQLHAAMQAKSGLVA
jgi:hypothetical protein